MAKRCPSPPFDRKNKHCHTNIKPQKSHTRGTRGSNTSGKHGLIVWILGKYIRTEIKCMETHKDEYPNTEEMKSLDWNFEYLTPSLHLLLQSIIKSRNGKLITASIGHAILQSTCPRSFLHPLQVGLGVMFAHKYGHQDLVDMIIRFGFCSFYTEASTYRNSPKYWCHWWHWRCVCSV